MFRLPNQLLVIAVGKMKTRPWKLAQDDYLKRLKRYGKVALVEVKDSVGRGFPDDVAMQREGDLLLKAGEGSRLILLTPIGQPLTSEQLAEFLAQQSMHYGRLSFLIGGPLGFAPEVTAAAHEQLALSPMTFTHELARVLLLEQLYRACTILNNEPYHK